MVSGSKPIVAEQLQPANCPGNQWRGASWKDSKPMGRDLGKDQRIGRSQRMASIAVANFNTITRSPRGVAGIASADTAKAPCTTHRSSAAKAWLAFQRNTAIVGFVSIAACVEGLDRAMTSALGMCGEPLADLIGHRAQKAGIQSVRQPGLSCNGRAHPALSVRSTIFRASGIHMSYCRA